MQCAKSDIQFTHKRVTFSVTSTVVLVQPKTRQELKAVWYSKDDMARFKLKACHSAEMMVGSVAAAAYIEQSLELDQRPSSNRFTGIEYICGIEHILSPAVLKMLHATKAMTIQHVLREQERQKKSGEYSPELIAEASMKTSLFSRAWRHNTAALNCIHRM
jgi:hypothetical protein